ncbi:MAG: DUF1097 domain-containing protein [Rhodospirillaceae bacterium]|jgi:hypothetical protein|nr:DUF1097 domain-containing protein [Rhodospirillaceae bacterium]MBT5659312.1 DUF1097 domain-containing protein [Rhodospirillaceae bacterium]MBT5752336.1 DUF1097 domain-containing protein [Rhodospirillaceae bacterium]
MSSLLALSISIGGLGFVATWLALGPLGPVVQIWGVFIGWGCYFASGGNAEGLKGAIFGQILGVVLAVVALNLLSAVPLGALTAPIWVGVTVFVLVFASQVEAFANIPAAVYGYATTAALALLGADEIGLDAGALDLSNPGAVAIISLVVGGIFGALSGRLAGVLGKG